MDWSQILASSVVGIVSGLAGSFLGYVGAKNSARRELISKALQQMNLCLNLAAGPGSVNDVTNDFLDLRGTLYALGVPSVYARLHMPLMITEGLERKRKNRGDAPLGSGFSLDELGARSTDLHLILGAYLAHPVRARYMHLRAKRNARRLARHRSMQSLF
ncbi:hypothetical protein [Flexivirga sp.]|uniref:hypothetical protein n=1 Tax=Flexivirga sp. TaxID=1962927 RepID=UPI003F7DFBF5